MLLQGALVGVGDKKDAVKGEDGDRGLWERREAC